MVGIAEIEAPMSALGALLGASAERPLRDPPLWPSDIADDATPVEFSIAFNPDGTLALRLLGETIAAKPGVRANSRACLRALTSLGAHYALSLDRLHQVQDLFLPQNPRGNFGLWYSMIIPRHATPEFKIYLNPNVHGRHQAPMIVAEALRRLGLDQAYSVITKYGLNRPQLDQFTFFALDLHKRPQSRVKIYIAHHNAKPTIPQRAAGAVPGVDPVAVAEFCSILGGDTNQFACRPLVSSFAFTEANAAVPNNYSLYLPIREIVSDDDIARQRVRRLITQRGLDTSILDRALGAVSTRALRDGVGLIAHMSLRLGPARPGLTVYLSSEAYRTTPPRPRTSPLALIKAS